MTGNTTPFEVFTIMSLRCNNERDLWAETQVPI